MSRTQFNRDPATYADIRQITADDVGRRLRITGFVVDVQSSSLFTLSDDTGRITVSADPTPALQSFVRILGSVIVSSDGQPMVRAELIQNLEGLDKILYKRSLQLLRAAPSGRKL